jgi:flagellar biogenesis protein FliO
MKRLLPLALTAALPAISLAQETFAGTKPNVVAPVQTVAPSGMGIMPMIQMLLALGIVVALLKFALPKMLSKVNKRLTTGLDSSIKIEETAAFAAGSLYIVTARTRTLLLCVSQSGVTCLADLTEQAPAKAEPPSFFEVLEEAETRPNLAVIQAQEVQEPEPAEASGPEADIQSALERLERLAH